MAKNFVSRARSSRSSPPSRPAFCPGNRSSSAVSSAWRQSTPLPVTKPLALTGVWELPKAAGALDGGDPIFFAPGTGLSGDSAPTGVLIGAATNGASADDPTVRVRLNGVTLGAPVAG